MVEKIEREKKTGYFSYSGVCVCDAISAFRIELCKKWAYLVFSLSPPETNTHIFITMKTSLPFHLILF